MTTKFDKAWNNKMDEIAELERQKEMMAGLEDNKDVLIILKHIVYVHNPKSYNQWTLKPQNTFSLVRLHHFNKASITFEWLITHRMGKHDIRRTDVPVVLEHVKMYECLEYEVYDPKDAATLLDAEWMSQEGEALLKG